MNNNFTLNSETDNNFNALGCCRNSFVKLSVIDWLSDLPYNVSEDDIVEVQFKNTRKGYYVNAEHIALHKGMLVAVEANPGYDIGEITLTGKLVPLQMKKNRIDLSRYEVRKILRIASDQDLTIRDEAKSKEQDTMIRARQLAAGLELSMKIGDVEYQGDKTKAIFYYIADERVDFRELIKVLAERFHVRIEMKQIGARQEAGRIGGIGPCGRELCCASWMTSFVSVTTHSARIQDISLNPLKLAGQCGKLKCCLNYELDCYLDALQTFPPTNVPLQTGEGTFYFFKYDIFKNIMWYSPEKDRPQNIVAVDADHVREIQEMNQSGNIPEKLGSSELMQAVSDDMGYSNVVELEDLTRFDDKNKKRTKPGKDNNRRNDNRRNNTDHRQIRDDRRQARIEQPRTDSVVEQSDVQITETQVVVNTKSTILDPLALLDEATNIVAQATSQPDVANNGQTDRRNSPDRRNGQRNNNNRHQNNNRRRPNNQQQNGAQRHQRPNNNNSNNE